MMSKIIKWSIFLHILVLAGWFLAITHSIGFIIDDVLLGWAATLVGLLLILASNILSIVVTAKQKIILLPVLLSLVPIISSSIILSVMFAFCTGGRICIPILEWGIFFASLIGFSLSVIIILIVRALQVTRKRRQTDLGVL